MRFVFLIILLNSFVADANARKRNSNISVQHTHDSITKQKWIEKLVNSQEASNTLRDSLSRIIYSYNVAQVGDSFKISLDDKNIFLVNLSKGIFVHVYTMNKRPDLFFDSLNVENYSVGNNSIARPLKIATKSTDNVKVMCLQTPRNAGIYPFIEYAIEYECEMGKCYILEDLDKVGMPDKMLLSEIGQYNKMHTKNYQFTSMQDVFNHYEE